MAKKIAEVPLPRDNFLQGYKPITPKFAPDDEDEAKEEVKEKTTLVESKPTEQTLVEKKKSVQTLVSDLEKEYLEKFFAQAPSAGKYCKIGLSSDHFELIDAIVKDLSPGMNKADYIWNVLENHFKTYGKVIRELFNKIPPKNPIDRFERFK